MGYYIYKRNIYPQHWEFKTQKIKSTEHNLKGAGIILSMWVFLWIFVIFPYAATRWVRMPDDMTIVWGATIQEQGMIGAGFAHEAIDFLVPLSNHVYVGWVNERSLNPFSSKDSAFNDLKPSDQEVLHEVYKQGLKIRKYGNQVLLLQFQPSYYPTFLTEYYSFRKYKYKIGRCMFETTAVPQGWVNVINGYLDELWVPSKFAKAVFLKEGVKKPIVVIKEGFDPEIFNRNTSVIDKNHFFGHCAKDYVFVAVSKWEDRKGWDVLLEAFTEEFSGLDRVCLAIRSTGLKDEIKTIYNPNHAKIIKVDKIPMSMYPSFFASADAFVLPTHGEGWGRTVMEAMAMGIPAIVSRWSGLSEFVNPDNAIPINITELEPAFPNEGKMFLGGGTQKLAHKWARIDKYALRGALRWAYTHQKESKAIGVKAEAFMHKYYTREVIAEDVHKRLSQIYLQHFKDRNLRFAKNHF